MPINWDDFKKELDGIVESGAKQTDDRLASRISSLTRMTDEEVKELFPTPADAEKLAQLMKVVKDSTDRNTKINQIVSNAEEFAGVILTLLGKYF
ncbi:MAG: hypothetical protein AB2L22_09975 [Syntrophales bacterium]